MARLNNDGSFDVTFGNGGRTIVDFNGGDDFAFAVATQPDGKIVAAGNTNNAQGSVQDFALVRFNGDGTLDATFGNGGKVQTNFRDQRMSASAIALQRDGKIFAGGSASSTVIPRSSFALGRYNSDGTLDTSFNRGGFVVISFVSTRGDINVNLNAALLQPDRKIIIAGRIFGSTSQGSDFVLGRINPDGIFDSMFGSFFGTVTTDFNNLSDDARSLALQKDGKIIAAGIATQSINNEDFALARYESDLPQTNPIDDATYFVEQHYFDFLNRFPDASGLAFWTNQIASCNGNAQCIDIKRQNVSAAYFLSTEFQETGFYVLRIQRAAFGRRSADASKRLSFEQFIDDSRAVRDGVIIGQSGAQQRLDQNKTAYALNIVNSSDFTSKYPLNLSAAAFVDALFASAGVTPTETERQDAINAFGSGGSAGRAATLRKVAESDSVKRAEFNAAFVLLEYFGYLRRRPTRRILTIQAINFG